MSTDKKLFLWDGDSALQFEIFAASSPTIQMLGHNTSSANIMTSKPPSFEPVERLNTNSDVQDVGNEQDVSDTWQTLLQAACSFPSDIFHTVMLNLIKNPNVTSSHLFRADILYDSGDDIEPHHVNAYSSPQDSLLSQLRPEFRPRPCQISGLQRQRTIVRQLIPRNPQLDRSLIQTCCFFAHNGEDEERRLVVYIPHVDRAEDMPFYHPTVKKLAFLHCWSLQDEIERLQGSLSISYVYFDQSPASLPPTKLERTTLRLLQTIHKHGQGQLVGYEKRVHLDRLIPQKRYQDTYTRLKTRYGRRLSERWVEVTDPGKHVFEDLGIAAYLIELWRDMYLPPSSIDRTSNDSNSSLPPFPGFVDIGCGNGLLVFILLSEGYPGWGFDARERKTWSIFPPEIRGNLKQRILVPRLLYPDNMNASLLSNTGNVDNNFWHDGVFKDGTFIVSNHADELTPWTPLFAAINKSSFIAIPCCSHDLSGARFRAPVMTKDAKARLSSTDESLSVSNLSLASNEEQVKADMTKRSTHEPLHVKQAAETGSLKKPEGTKKMPSAYSSLCSYVASLAGEAGFVPETDVLRIPSTRNQCIVGRVRRGEETSSMHDLMVEDRIPGLMREIVEKEMNQSLAQVSAAWVERARKLALKPSSGH